MRLQPIAALLVSGIFLTACGDSLTNPDTLDPTAEIVPVDSGVASATVTPNPGEGDDDCDPWMELDWCQCGGDQMHSDGSFTSADGDAGATENQSLSGDCDGGGSPGSPGGGGPGGGGPGGSSDPHLNEQVCPNCRELDQDELNKLNLATAYICPEGKGPVTDALSAGEYGMRAHSWPIRGWHHLGYHTGDSEYHYSLNESHPGWTGILDDGVGTPLGPEEELIELAGTMVHEYFHHKYPNDSEAQIRARTQNCVPGYRGD